MIKFFIFINKIYKKNWVPKRIFRFPYSLLVGMCLGLFKRDDLAKIDRILYDERKEYFNDEHNKHLHKWEKQFVKRYFSKVKTIYITAVGGGRELYGFHKLGFKVAGCEYNSLFRKNGNEFFKRENLPLAIEPVERDDFPELNKTYDAVIIGWGSYIHVKGRDVRVNMLRKASKVLEKDGIIVVSYWPAKWMRLNSKRLEKVGNFFARIRGNETVERGDCLDPEFVKFYHSDEIKEELNDAGFDLFEYQEDEFGVAIGKKR
ncbi:hypothetical protein [Natronoflexus pectinivorans]|uniref:Methyltransferase family protein n=1 Tax=Natronoflexus pectinivorans TaxID=682526 RepID=A0A4R2GFP9_9BACT|nr:hypothetical protein [Natronoflexus pectinivorans]TCO06840.1 hypothetical protein EV194_11264 [Natronoflexus pectinivorans]